MTSLYLQLDLEDGEVVASLARSMGSPFARGRSSTRWEDLVSDPVLRRISAKQNPDGSSLQVYGGLLGDAALPLAIRPIFLERLRLDGIRLLLVLDTALEELPWELAGIEGMGALLQHPAIRVSRWCSGQHASLAAGEFKILVASADPRTGQYPRLAHSEAEMDAVRAALADEGHLVECLPNATANSLTSRLKSGRYRAFHFIGHGDLAPSGALLVLEGGSPGEISTLYADDLRDLLLTAGIQLATFSACRTAAGQPSLCSKLAEAGIPAVIGMQFSVDDAASHLFSRTLYSGLSRGMTVEDAVFEARAAIAGVGQDWCAPVLHSSHPDGALTSGKGQTSAPNRSNLPLPLNEFVGREEVIAQCAQLLQRERLVVLLGPGGIGKTRVSMEIGRSVGHLHPHGVWQVLLDGVTDQSRVMEAVGRVFGICAASDQSLNERVVGFLSDRNLVLILDNCEHLLEGSRQTALEILAKCPDVRILATSREPLRVAGERIVKVESLAYPCAEDSFDFDSVVSFEAIRLLVLRAMQADNTFTAERDNIRDLALIAKRLDGVPLALELAASRVRTFSPKQIMERLLTDLAWLDLENPAMVPRQKTLRATLDWSYKLLSEDERTVFNRLSVFRGSFSLEGVEAVAGFGRLGGIEAMNALSGLVDKSLVAAENLRGGKRFRLLDMCRDYALQKLAALGEVEATRDRHLEFVRQFTLDAFKGMFREGQDHATWSLQLAMEHENCLAAIDWGTSSHAGATASAAIVGNLFHHWYTSKNFAEAKKAIGKVLAKLPPEEERSYARLLALGGVASVFGGDETGLTSVEQASALALKIDPAFEATSVAGWLGECAYMLGHFDLAFAVYERIIENRRVRGLDGGSSQLMQGVLKIHRNNLAEAEADLTDFFERQLKSRDFHGAGLATCHLAHLDMLRGGNRFRALFAEGLNMLASGDEDHALADFLPLASSVFLPDYPETAAAIQGFAEKLIEESGSNPDRLLAEWGNQAIDRTVTMLQGRYPSMKKEGRTMNLNHALRQFSGS